LTGTYNLIEYSYPEQHLCKDIQPVLAEARNEFKNVQFILCNLNRAPQSLMKYKPTQNKSYPEAALVDGQGNVLMTWSSAGGGGERGLVG
jgi:hypothetical protein